MRQGRYVAREYIGTCGCGPSPLLCAMRLSGPVGRDGAAWIQNPWTTSAKDGGERCPATGSNPCITRQAGKGYQMVYVISQNGKPLMPTEHHGKVRWLLKRKRAKVVILCYIHGRRSSGYFDIRKLDGTKVHSAVHYRKLTLVKRTNTRLIERRKPVPLPPAEAGVSPANI